MSVLEGGSGGGGEGRKKNREKNEHGESSRQTASSALNCAPKSKGMDKICACNTTWLLCLAAVG